MHVAPPLEQTDRFRHFSCPECRSALEQSQEEVSGMVTYLCRVGHRYTARELLVGRELVIEQMLWSSLAAVDELLVMMSEVRTPPSSNARSSRRLSRATSRYASTAIRRESSTRTAGYARDLRAHGAQRRPRAT
jgi:hypothetical protein